jgi:POTRA domain, FtsQ-type
MSGSPPRTRRPAGRPAAGAPVSPGPPRAPRPSPAGPPRMGWKAAFFGLAVIAIAGAVAWALLGSRFLIVRSVQVTGTGPTVSRAQVIAAARIQPGLPLIRVNTSAVAHRVGAIRQIQSAQVSRDWPHTIVISVRLRTPVFTVAVPGGYALVDAFGVDLRSSARRPPGFPLLLVGSAAGEPWPGAAAGSPGNASGTGHTHKSGAAGRSGHARKAGRTKKPGAAKQPGPASQPAGTPRPSGASTPGGTGDAARAPLRGNPAVRAAATVLRELPPVIAHRVRAVLAPTASDVWMRLTGGVVIVWGDTSRPAEKAKELSLLMRTHARGYDVSAPGTAVTQG